MSILIYGSQRDTFRQLIALAIKLCYWIYGSLSKSHIGSYKIIDFKDFKAL